MTTTLAHSAFAVADGIHIIQSIANYADEAARIAATGFVQADVGRVVQQTDTGSFWALVEDSPIRWQRIAGPMPIRTQSGSGTYTCTIHDADACVRMTSGSANAPTIPPNSSVPFAIGDTILFRQAGAGLMTLTAGAGVTLNGSSLVSVGQHSTLCATKVATDTWDVSGKTT